MLCNKKSLKNFTSDNIKFFQKNCTGLNLIKPDFEPLISLYIKNQLSCVFKLIALNLISNKKKSLYVKIKPYFKYLDKKNVRFSLTTHFVIWKKKGMGSNVSARPRVFWKNPWTFIGRPSWHIGCSSLNLSFAQKTLHLHTGGFDLKFPHHKNETFQVESLAGYVFSANWLYIGHLETKGIKMSKSLSNFYTLEDLCKGSVRKQNHLRLFLLKSRYGFNTSFTEKHFEGYCNKLKAIEGCIELVSYRLGRESFFKKNLLLKGFKGWGLFFQAWKKVQFNLDFTGLITSLFKTLKRFKNFMKYRSRRYLKSALLALYQTISLLGLDLQIKNRRKYTVSVLIKLKHLQSSSRFTLADYIRSVFIHS